MRVLLATDGSGSAESAVEFLRGFPLPKDAELYLLTVIDKEVYRSNGKKELSSEHQQVLDQTRQILDEDAAGLLDSVAARLAERLSLRSTLVRSGHPADEIISAAREIDADLVVVGSHGLGNVKRFLLGSVSDHVLQYAHCSVLIARPPGRSGERGAESSPVRTDGDRGGALRILVAYDESARAKEAVAFCASLPLGKRTKVTVMSVLPLMTGYRQDVVQQLSWVWREKKKLARKGLDWATKAVPWATPQVSGRLEEGPDVTQLILDTAEELGCDLIVVGNKGKGAIEKFLLGSVTRRLAHHAHCSVLAVRG